MKNTTHFQPMLAHKWNSDRIDWSKNNYIQSKLDGVRCVMKEDGCYSRNGKKFHQVDHLYTKKIKDLFKQNPWLVLDGELYTHDLKDDFPKLVGIVKRKDKTPENARIARQIQFWVYDFVMVNPRTNKVDKIEADMNRYSSRYKSLSNLPIFGKYIKLCPTYNLISESMLKVYHAKLLKDGYEGSIVRCDGPYKNGRSFDLMKVKDFSDTEATIIDWVEGKGKRAGTIGKFIGKDEDGVEFGIPIMDKQSKLVRDFEEMKRWIGKTCTFTYFERTPAGSYRHPLFKTLRSYE